MRVLFVEDDQMNRRVVRDMLHVCGADMAEAEDAESGLRMIDANPYDIVLMDLRMPGMDGLTAIRHIRSRPDGKAQVPIIVVTADAGVGIKQSCMDGGADDVIMKPVAMKALFGAMGRVVLARAQAAA